VMGGFTGAGRTGPISPTFTCACPSAACWAACSRPSWRRCCSRGPPNFPSYWASASWPIPNYGVRSAPGAAWRSWRCWSGRGWPPSCCSLLRARARSSRRPPTRALGWFSDSRVLPALPPPQPPLAAAAPAAMIAATIALPSASAPIYVTRSFFGTHRVIDSAAGDYRLLLHGTTLHGLQQNRSGAALVSRPIPLAYYHPTGPLARALNLARGATAGPLRVGIVGLGTGAMACYAAADDHWRFFEIDAAIVHIATPPSLFRYIARCLPAAEIVLGDARLTLARQNDGAFDFLMVDAFSSDAIPMPLITVEALRLYLNKLADRGILALHVSNQNLDLPPVLEANLAALSA